MDEILERLYRTIQEQVTQHKELLNTAREEYRALVDADVKKIQEHTFEKEGIIANISRLESKRLGFIGEMAAVSGKSIEAFSLKDIILEVEGKNSKLAESLRSAHNALVVLVQRIMDQNEKNENLIQKSLEHIQAMKKNVLGEANRQSDTYNSKGRRKSDPDGSRPLVSEEA